MRTEYADMPFWEKLASKKKVRLPQSRTALTTGYAERVLRLCGWTIREFQEFTGCKSLRQWIALNPSWSARAFTGLMLEVSNYKA